MSLRRGREEVVPGDVRGGRGGGGMVFEFCYKQKCESRRKSARGMGNLGRGAPKGDVSVVGEPINTLMGCQVGDPSHAFDEGTWRNGVG